MIIKKTEYFSTIVSKDKPKVINPLVNETIYREVYKELSSKNVQLVAVSKTKPVEEILALYRLGQKDFGENYVQELIGKAPLLPSDIRWHFIGHLQTNKVKPVVKTCELIHGVDRIKLLQEINKAARSEGKTQKVLLQVFIAREETKFGMNEEELLEATSWITEGKLPHVRLCGLMGMASFSDNKNQILSEFSRLKQLFDLVQKANQLSDFKILSMGMSQDFQLAIEAGSNMVRIGSLLFGKRS